MATTVMALRCRGALYRDAELLAASDNCRFALLPTTDSGSPARSGYRLASEVRRLAEFCLQRKVCPKILLMGSKSGTTWLSGHFVGPSLLVNGNVENDNVHSCEIMQDTVNMMVDIGIDQLVRYLATGENPGTVALPDVTNQFPSDSISLVGGTFSDIRTLKRQSNVGISRSGKKLTLAMQISLEKLVIEYERYELHSIMSTDGLLTGSIAGASIAAQLSVNYEQQLCAVTLDSLKVTHLGTIKFEMTGLGVFNSLVRHLSTWLTGKFHNSVVSALESIIRQNIEDMLSSIDCETYRAWV